MSYPNPAVYRGTDLRLAERAYAIWRDSSPTMSDAPTVYGRRTIYTVRAVNLSGGLPPGEYGFLTPQDDKE